MKKQILFRLLSIGSTLLVLIELLAPIYALYVTKSGEKQFEGYKTLGQIVSTGVTEGAGYLIGAFIIADFVILVWELICFFLKFKFDFMYNFVKIILIFFILVVEIVGGFYLAAGISLIIFLAMIFSAYYLNKNQE